MANTQFQFMQSTQSEQKSPLQNGQGKGRDKKEKKRRKTAKLSAEQQRVGTVLHGVLKPMFEKRTGKIVGMILQACTCERIREMMEAHKQGDAMLVAKANECLAMLVEKDKGK